LAGPRSQALELAKSQRGGSVRGTLELSQAAGGGRLEVDLFAQSASLAKTKHGGRVRVGRLRKSSLAPGKLVFSVRLDARARRALRRRHSLPLKVRVVVVSAAGTSLTVTRTVVERA
jgi:hypothetical protein